MAFTVWKKLGQNVNMGNKFNEKAKLLTTIGFSIAFFILGVILTFFGDSNDKITGGIILGGLFGYWIK